MKQGQLIAIALLFTLLPATRSIAQTNIPLNTVVTQNFNGIGSSATAALPANWKMSSVGTGASSGWATGTNITATTQAASSGSPVAGGAYNWATTAGTDRAIGFMTNGYASPNSVMAFYRNTTGATVTSITVRFAVERYRINTATFSLSFFSSTDGTAWTAQTAGDIGTSIFATGASAYSFGSPQIIYKTVTITGLSILNNGDFYLRWLFTNTGSTNAQGLGLDDVSLFAGTATPVIVAQLRDALTIDNPPLNQANPGDQITYTDVIKNTGSGDATGVTLTNPAPAQTTYNPGSLKTSSLAKDDNYATPLNTTLNVAAAGVLTNDFGMPAPSVLSFGPVANSAATAAAGAGSSDNGGTLTVNANGSFNYTPPTGFVGNDKFAYLAGNGNLPNNDGFVTIAVGSAPSAVNDAYNVIGNVQINPTIAQGLLNNDLGSGLSVTAVNGSAANVGVGITTSGGGNLTVNANGSFTYNPLAGFDGPTDNFTYSIDNGFSSPSSATVTLNISGMVWFINAAAGAGDGRLSTPFNTITAFQAVNNGTGNNPAVNDYIFIYENASAYTGPITLLNGQKLIGQDATASLSTITGLTPAVYSSAFPAMNTGAPVTTIGSASNAVNLNGAAGTNLLRGFTVGNTTGSGINGSSFGTLTILDVSKNGTGQALALTSGAFAAGATIDNITTTSSVNAISLTTVTGTLSITTGAISGATGTAFNVSGGTVSVTYSGGITQANNAAMVSIAGGHATGTITFQAGTLNATNGTGLQFDNADGTYNFFGTNTLAGGDAGIDILNGSGGTFNFATTSGSIAITSPTGTAFNVSGPTGTITYDGNITQATNAAMVSIAGGHTGTIDFVTGNTLNATNGTGLQFDNADGTYNFFGTNTLAGGDAGIDILNGSGGTFNFATTSGSIVITDPSGTAFNVGGTSNTAIINYDGNITKNNAGTMISIVNHTTGTITFVTGNNLNAGTASTGNGIQFDNADGTYNFNGTTTLNGGDAGIDLVNGCGGTFSFPAGISITNPTNEVIRIINSTANFTYGGGFTKNNNSISGITISGNTGGTIAINGSGTKTLSTGTGNAVNLTTNTGTTINFSNNNLVLTTTTGVGFNATGGGTISVTGTGNTITSTTGIALNVANTTIGSSDLIFQSISASGAVNGIYLENTGTSGGLIVTGTGAANSGGTIQNTTSHGIVANNTQDLSLTGMLISAPALHGIYAPNLRGTCLVSNTSILNWVGATSNGIDVVNVSTNLALLTVTGCTFNGTNTNNDGIFMEAQGTSSMALSVEGNCLFTDMFGDGVQVNGITGSTGTVNVTIKNSTFNNAAVLGNGGISLQVFGGINFIADIDNNSFNDIMRPITNLGAIGGTNGLTATANITIRNNTLNNIVGSRGITFAADGSGLTTLLIDNNSIDRLGSTTKYAIQVNMISASANVKIINNDVGQAANLWTSGNGTAEAILCLTQNSSTMNVLLSGNVVTANASLEVMRVRAIQSSTLNATVTGNNLNDINTTHIEFAAATGTGAVVGGNICLNISGNIVPAAGVGVIQINENAAPGNITVTQASAAAVAAANSGATVTVAGTPTFGQPACTTPPIAPPPLGGRTTNR